MPGATAAVRLVGLTKKFGGGRGVSDLDLAVDPGQVFGFLGPNGAGKSTTIRLMMGLYRADSGRAEVLGIDAASDAEVRRRVGYLPGELSLYPQLTGRDTLDRLARIRGHADAVHVRDLAERFGAELDRPLHALSKGNRQKIGLIAAFMHRPDLLVLDEPTSGLDPLLQREFSLLLEELVARGVTVFLSSHDLVEVQRLAHRVAIIRNGRIVAHDTVEALRAAAPRTVNLTFKTPPDPTAIAAVRGCDVTSSSGRHLSFRVVGGIGPLLEAALPQGLEDVETHSADLDDLFLDYYADNEDRSHEC